MSFARRMGTFTCAAVLASVVTASAQQPAPSSTVPTTVATDAALDALLAAQVRADDANRQIVRDVLGRSEVREVAAKAGLDLKRATQAVSMLDGAELQEIAAQARHVDASLAGGASTVVISTTTIIIVLLLVILIVVAT
jgi:hypothetical protein